MTFLCRVLTHRIAPHVSHNQGFAFSQCRRCGRDMIRSTGAQKSSEWRNVPAGFRVVWGGSPGQDPAQAVASDPTPGQQDGLTPKLAHDLLRVGGAALYWSARDALRELPRRRARVLRLPAG